MKTLHAFIQRHRLGLLFFLWCLILAWLTLSPGSAQPAGAGTAAQSQEETTGSMLLERFIPLRPAAEQSPKKTLAESNQAPGPTKSETWHGAHELDELPRPLVSLETLFLFPDKAAILGIRTALVLVELEIDLRGNIVTHRILRGAGNGFDEEVLAKLPSVRFSPGRIDGRAVAVRARLPIRFVLRPGR